MNRTSLNFWLDLILLVVFCVLAWCSVVIRYVFPIATESEGWSVWGWGYNEWLTLQFSLLSILAFGILIHITLHWTWVMGVIGGYLGRRRQGKRVSFGDGTRTLIGVGLLIVLLHLVGIGVGLAAFFVKSPEM